MIGKKINQLATELAPASTDLTIIGNPTTGVSKKITLAQLGAIFSGAVSFYTNYASFPATGTTDVIFCAKDTQKLYLWSGSAYVEVFPSQALLDTYQLRSEKGNANGYASLDSQGKVPISQLPSSIMEYKGTWSAATNTPTLANGTGDTGDVYICNAAGSVNFGAGAISFAVGDYVIYSGTIWQRSSGAVGTVTSVAITESGDALTITGSPITTSGTINIGFAGTGTQYIKGDGTLATFPSIISQAQNLVTEVYNSTGATLTKGTIVYINGGQGNLPTVTKAIATGDSTSAQTYGIVQADITNMNNGYVVVAGRLSDLDTQAYTEGTQLYLSSTTAGAYTSTKQYAPAHLVYVGIIVRSHPTQGIIEVKIQNGYELDEIHNVAAQTPSNNDGLFWEASTSLWKNKSLSTILGYTPADDSLVVHKAGTETITGAKTFTSGIIVSNSGIQISGSTSDWLNVEAAGEKVYYGTSFIRAWDKQSGGSRIISLRPSGLTTGNDYVVSFPAKSGTIAFTDDLSGGTVTSVGLSSATSGVTIGSTPITTSGTITLAIATASGSQQGLLSSTDWTTFNNKQNALTNPVTGTGTTNYLPKFTGTSTIGDSLLTDNGTTLSYGNNLVTVGASNTSEKYLQFLFSTGDLYLGGTSAEHYFYGAGAKPINFYTNGTQKMRLDASGNLGLGVTPSASWATGFRAIQMTSGVALISHPTVPIAYLGANYLATDSGAKYISSDFSSRFLVNGFTGGFSWEVAPSGTAGNAISFTQAMTLDASGNLGVGSTSPSNRLQITAAAGSSHARWTESATTVGFVGGAQGIISGHNGKFAVRGESGLVLSGSGNSADVIIASGGAATFSSSVTATNFLASNGGLFGWGAGSTFIDGDSSNQYIRFIVNNSERVRINSSGSVGIGTTSPSYKQHILTTDYIGQFIQSTYLNSSKYYSSTLIGYNIAFNQASEFGYVYDSVTPTNSYTYLNTYGKSQGSQFALTAAGNVGIGTASPSSNSKLAVSNDGANGFEFDVVGASTELRSYNRSTSAYTDLTTIASNIMFQAGGSERMRITNGGEVLINMTTTTTSGSGTMLSQGSAFANVRLFGTGSHTFAQFFLSGTQIGSITGSGSTTSYNTSSDYRLKQDLKDFNGLDLVSKLKAYDYEWKSDKTRSYGVIAHELQSVINYAVTGVKDGKEMQGVDYSKIVPVLIKAIQELNDKIK
jgi:hypothetical protein